MNYLIDTCVLSELKKTRPNAGVVGWVKSISENSIFLSVITLGEIQKGISKLVDTKKRAELIHWLSNDLLFRFSSRCLIVDTAVAMKWGELHAQSELNGRPVPVVDCMLAATAIIHNLTLTTRNTSDFSELPVRIVDPYN